ncbi:MAG: hypothetical protein AAF726_23580 [Planctomycetota bacterium]
MTSKHFLSGVGLALLLAGTASAQANDDCSGATAISGFGTFAFDNTSATGSGISDCNGVGVRKDLWYVWTSPATALVRFGTCNTTTSFDTRVAAYDGVDCNNLMFLGCGALNCGGQSSVSFDAIQGQQYLLRVGSRVIGQGGPGQFITELDPCPASNDDGFEDNDDCGSSTVLGDGSYANLWVSKTDPDWYQFCVPGGGSLQLDVLFSNGSGDIDIFSFDGCGGGSLGIGGSGSDDENLTIDNTGTSPLIVNLRIELWPSDPNNDCNFYTFNVSGTGTGCGSGSVGTNYCMANPNSTGSTSAMSGAGSPVASVNNLTLQADNIPTNAFGFFLTSQTQGFAMNPGGSQGNICLAGSIGRYVGPGQIQQAGANGLIELQLDLTMIPQPNGFVAAMSGQTWNFQAWYRDAVMGSATSNFSDGLEVAFQ